MKTFKNKIFVKDNVIDIVNNLDFKNIAQIYLLIKKNQEISAHFTFGRLQAGSYENILPLNFHLCKRYDFG